MAIDWAGLDELEVAQKILGCACDSGAKEINISTDYRGIEIFFIIEDSLEMFEHLPEKISVKLKRFLKHISNIDSYRQPPMEGFASMQIGCEELALTVKTIKGAIGEDLTISICKL